MVEDRYDARTVAKFINLVNALRKKKRGVDDERREEDVSVNLANEYLRAIKRYEQSVPIEIRKGVRESPVDKELSDYCKYVIGREHARENRK